jgi:hypothetical protein
MLIKKGDDLFRMPSEVIVTVLETFRGVLDPEQFLLQGLLHSFFAKPAFDRPSANMRPSMD